MCTSISPTKFKPNLCSKTLFAIPEFVRQKKASHPVHSKKPRPYVVEIDPSGLFQQHFIL
jgi:hypothetical protein